MVYNNMDYFVRQQIESDKKKKANQSNIHQLQRFHSKKGPGLKNNYVFDFMNKSRIVKNNKVYNCGYGTPYEKKKCGV